MNEIQNFVFTICFVCFYFGVAIEFLKTRRGKLTYFRSQFSNSGLYWIALLIITLTVSMICYFSMAVNTLIAHNVLLSNLLSILLGGLLYITYIARGDVDHFGKPKDDTEQETL